MIFNISKKGLLHRTLTVSFVLLIFFIQPILCNAAVVWSDDFDDGNYDGWTVADGSFSASEFMLEATGDFPNNIYHESTVITGTWSFDILVETTIGGYCLVFLNGKDYSWLGDSFGNGPGNSFILRLRSNQLVLHKFTGGGLGASMGSYTHDSNFDGGFHFDITINSDGKTFVYLDEEEVIESLNIGNFETSEYFHLMIPQGIAFDNITVSDTLDPPIETTTTATTTTTETPTETITEESTTTTSPTPTGDGFETTLMLLIGGGLAAVVVVLLIVWKVKGS
jgi:hypothetical protein